MDIQSKLPAIRMRSITSFRVLLKFLTVNESVWFSLMYLSDSNPEVREAGKRVLILENMFSKHYAALEAIRVRPPTHHALLDTFRLPSMDLLAVTVNTFYTESESKRSVLTDHLDPFNVKYYGSVERKGFSTMFGLAESFYDKCAKPYTNNIISGIVSLFTVKKPYSPEQVSKLSWLLEIECTALMHQLIQEHPVIAEEVIEDFISAIEESFEYTSDALPTGAVAPNDKSIEDLEQDTHRIDILHAILLAHENFQTEKLWPWMTRLESMMLKCINDAKSTRESLYTQFEQNYFFYNDYVDVPITSFEQYETLESFKMMSHEATIELANLGKTDKLAILELEKNELFNMMDTKGEYLRRLNLFLMHFLSGYSLFFSLSKNLPEKNVLSAFQFLLDILPHENRGVRTLTVEALVVMAKLQLQCEGTTRVEFSKKIESTVNSFMKLTMEEKEPLYRRKADFVVLVVQLCIALDDSKKFPCSKLLQFCSKLWKDNDSQVRALSIKMVQALGESGYGKEVKIAFQSNSRENLMPELALVMIEHEDEAVYDLMKFVFN